ncbi:hypothetical protein H0H81_001908 [Sphagnurus paluster]|uniref:Histidinol-phosphatase n=1 Tax=Sphagnurus paluster TaxID=117069 RepID=A0A9P7FTB7_9AGAR|nr:hypothetical protein H0H81_001908 [Sphagnurus paluster]
MPHSHHSHSGQFCKHAKGRLEEVVAEAIRQGFELYGLTEHVPRYRAEDFYPEEAGLSLDTLITQFEAFLDEAHHLKALYAPQITLLVGLETEYITDLDLVRLETLLARLGPRIEYIVGSVHHVSGIPIDLNPHTYHQAVHTSGFSLAADPSSDVRLAMQGAFLEAYFDAQYTLLQRFHPEVVGHFDLCRLYELELRFADYPDAWAKLERNIAYAVEYGALFEVNAAAFRKGWDTAYPRSDVVQVRRKSSRV